MKRKLPSWLRENLELKLLSGVFAFLVWCSVGADAEREENLRMRVEVRDIPAGWVLMEDPPDILVTVSGRERVLKSLSGDSMRVAEIGPLAAGQRIWQVRAADLSLPDGLTVTSITPSDVPLRLEERLTRSVDVSLSLRGAVPTGYEVLSARVVPDKVEISAPASYFPELTSIDTETIDLDGMLQNPRRRVTLAPQRPFIHWDRDIAFTAEIQIAVVEEERFFEAIPLTPTGPLAARCTLLAVDHVQALVRGPRAILANVDADGVFATIDCGPADAEEGTWLGTPELHNIPAALRVLDLVPGSVRYQRAPAPEPEPEAEPPAGDEPGPSPDDPGATHAPEPDESE